MTHLLPTRVTISPEVLVQKLEDEFVLLDLQSERYFGLDDVGTRMWQLLAEDGEVVTVCKRLLETYQVDEGTLHHDLAVFIGRLAEAGLVSVES